MKEGNSSVGCFFFFSNFTIMELMHKNIDTILTGFTSICTIELFHTAQDVTAIYSLFVQSLVAIAAIGKLLFDYYKHKKPND